MQITSSCLRRDEVFLFRNAISDADLRPEDARALRQVTLGS